MAPPSIFPVSAPVNGYFKRRLLANNNRLVSVCSNGKAESTQDLVFFHSEPSPHWKRKRKKEGFEKTKWTAAGIRTHDLRTVSRRPNDMTMQDNRRPAAYAEHSSYLVACCM